MANTESTSSRAMARFIEQSPGLREPRLAVSNPKLPTLPDLKKLAQDRRAAGHEVIDQSAGDIADLDQPLSDAFYAWIETAREELIGAGYHTFRRPAASAYGFPENYQQQFPPVTDTLARSWGIEATPFRALQTISGRTVIDLTLRGLGARADAERKGTRRGLILDPLAWSGYMPLAADLGLDLIHAPSVPGHGLACSAEGVAAALEFAHIQGIDPIGIVPILPSNPTGVGVDAEELARIVEVAAEADVPVMIDAFYSPLAPEGHAAAVPLGALEARLAPEALAYLGVIVGETKVVSSQNKTGSLIWFAPAGHETIARQVWARAGKRMRATNAYPRPREALVAYALHTFPGGVHEAMGPRYTALDETRGAMRAACDEHGIPLSIGGSFYGTAALVDDAGQSLVRDAEGAPITDAQAVSAELIRRYGIVGAPGGMFSSAPEANKMIRLTAAVTLEDVARLQEILGAMKAEAAKHG